MRKALELVVLGVAGELAAVFLMIGLGWLVEKIGVWSGLGGWIPAETGPHAEWMPFLQGGTDWGGGAMYALEALAGVCYLALASWLLTLWMALARKESPDGAGWGKRTFRALWFFVPCFLACGALWIAGAVQGAGCERGCSSEFDADVLMGTVLLVGGVTAAWTAWVDGRRWRLGWKLLAAPAAVALWVFMAWDGQTPRAGQRLWAGQEPLPAVRSWRHAAMLAWYDLWVERPKTGGEDALLWFWTDGRNEFGTRLEDSPSARALRKRTDLPWTDGRPVFAIPLAAGSETTVGEAMPYCAQMRHYGGYFFQTPDGVLQIRQGVIHSVVPCGEGGWACRTVDVHLPPGTPYWALRLTAAGEVTGELRAFSNARGFPPPPEPILATATSLEEVLSGERAPVLLQVEGAAPLAAEASCLRRLSSADFDEVFVE